MASSQRTVVVAATLALAAGAVASWAALKGRLDDLETRVRDAERELSKAEHEAANWRLQAETEMSRTRGFEERVRELERQQAAGTVRPPAQTPPRKDPRPPAPPATWDDATLRQAIDRLSGRVQQARQTGQFARVVEALRARPWERRTYLLDVLKSPGMRPEMVRASAMLLGELDDERAVAPLLARLSIEQNPDVRQAVLAALAVLPGEGQLPVFVEAWKNPSSSRHARRAAMQGLAARGHPVALDVARTKRDGVGAAMRHVALGNLLVRAREADFADPVTLPVFEDALGTLEGPRQASVVLEALAGFSTLR